MHPSELRAVGGRVPLMTTLSDLRAKLRIDLSDTDSNVYRWTDATLDRHIAHALEDLSLAIPRELTATVATTAGSREVDISSLTGLVTIEKVEFPVGQFPPEYIDFGYWAGELLLHTDDAPDGSDATVHYVARHVVDGAGSTLPSTD